MARTRTKASSIITEDGISEELANGIEIHNADSVAEFEPESKSESQPKLKAKTLGNTDQNGCKKNVEDVIMFGDDLFKLLSKASSEAEGFMKSTKAMDVGKGCIVQVTTQQRNQDGSYSVAEALTFVPGVKIIKQLDTDGNVKGRHLKGSN